MTHLPFLIGLARILPVKRVLEFGSGKHSTLMFLNRSAFPDLIELHSFENDLGWYRGIAEMVEADARCCIRHVGGPVHLTASEIELDGFDLILIDDSVTAAERAKTISAVAQRKPSGVVAIHDYEVYEYRRTARPLANRYIFTALAPHTAIAWNNRPIKRQLLRSLDSFVYEHGGQVQPKEPDKWVALIDTWKGYSV